MAKVRNEQDLNKEDYNNVFDHAQVLEKRINKIIQIVNENHKINLIHKIKENILKIPCAICKIDKVIR